MDDMLRKIQALLTKAEGTDNENEAEAFFSKARELMLKYAIDEATVRAAQGAAAPKTEAPIMEEYMYSTSDGNAVGKKTLLHIVARANRVRMVDFANQRHSNLGRPGNQGVASQWCALVGFCADITMVKMLYVSLLIQGARLGSVEWRRTAGNAQSGKSKYMTGFLVGFGSRLRERFAESERQAGPGMALVLANDTIVGEALKGFFPRLKTSHANRVDYAGQMAGRAAGDRADIGSPKVAGGGARLGAGR